MTPSAFSIAVGTFGAILQELLFWYNARYKLAAEEYRAILTSARYWIVVTAMAIGSGIAAYVWFLPWPASGAHLPPVRCRLSRIVQEGRRRVYPDANTLGDQQRIQEENSAKLLQGSLREELRC